MRAKAQAVETKKVYIMNLQKREISISKMPKGFGAYPCIVKQELSESFGCEGSKGNFTLKKEPSFEVILAIRDLISSSDGMLPFYQLWYCEIIKRWRLCFGYE